MCNSKVLDLGDAQVCIRRYIRFVFQPQDKGNLCNKMHSSTITDAESGEVICVDCGIVISDKIEDISPEWRTFAKDQLDSRSRAGMPMSLAIHDQGLSTIIGRDNKDFTGKIIIDSSMRSLIERIRTWKNVGKLYCHLCLEVQQLVKSLLSNYIY